jgi:2-polyprenyl-6-methoxyphenol hydroxylase-like FAD-dependent oxidoreductase
VLADLSRLPTRFPYITMMPQARFLDFLASELSTMPSVRLMMGAAVHGLLWDDPWGLSGTADRVPAQSTPQSPASGRGGWGGGFPAFESTDPTA